MAIIYEKKDHIAYLTINRPEALNALDIPTWVEMDDACEDFHQDPDTWVMVVTGAGDKAFSTGGDMKSLIPAISGMDPEAYEKLARLRRPKFFSDIYKPIIAAINGFCLGGGTEMILGTDIRIAVEHATFGITEARWGLYPGGGSSVRLPRQISWCHAMEMLLTAQRITAEQALQMGLINRVVPVGELMPTVEEFARNIAANGPLAVRSIKEAAVRSKSMSLESSFSLENYIARLVFASEDAKEGPTAFLEKRKPNFTGR